MATTNKAFTDNITTGQKNIKSNVKDLTGYSLFLGGLNVKSKALEQYNPLKTGYSRIFFVKMPRFLEKIMPNKTKNFKHIMEYGFKSIDGIQNLQMEFEQITGGYAGRSFEIPTIAKDETNAITIKVQEMSGSPIREYVEMWITGVSDPHTGMAHYHGAIDLGIEYGQGNHTGEAIYVSTDATGRNVEFACLLSNMMPKVVKRDQFNYESGTHAAVEYDVEYTCTMYTSPDVNTVATKLLDRYKILTNYLDFKSDYIGAPSSTHAGTINPDKFPLSNIKDWTTGQ